MSRTSKHIISLFSPQQNNMLATSGGVTISGHPEPTHRAEPYPEEQHQLRFPSSHQSTGIAFTTWTPPSTTALDAQQVVDVLEVNRPEPTITPLDLPPSYEHAIATSTSTGEKSDY